MAEGSGPNMPGRILPHLTAEQLYYSDTYVAPPYEYRHVICPVNVGPQLRALGLLTEEEVLQMGVDQSPGWENYMTHGPEPHVLLFRRPIPGAA